MVGVYGGRVRCASLQKDLLPSACNLLFKYWVDLNLPGMEVGNVILETPAWSVIKLPHKLFIFLCQL